MNGAASRSYDAAIIGAGPAGSLCALALARKGARVVLLEGNPKAANRLAGEWLHPPAVRILHEFGTGLELQARGATGKGFVVFPEDGSEPIALNYPDGSHSLVCEHSVLVARLREAAENEAGVDFIPRARVRGIEGKRVDFSQNGAVKSLGASRIVGADGRASTVRQSLGYSMPPMICSRIVGVLLKGVELPWESYGHVLCGGPGPILMYRLDEHSVRVLVDVPLDRWTPRDRISFLTESYAAFLPATLRLAFVEALQAGQFQFAANALRPRVSYGSPDRVIIGDAAGHYHPMTAAGMTLGLGDAHGLAECNNFHDFSVKRFRATRVPELLAMGLYEIFADHRAEAVALRQAIYQRWRKYPRIRDQSMGILACENTSRIGLGLAFSATVVQAACAGVPRTLDKLAWRRAGNTVYAFVVRLGWLLRGLQRQSKAKNPECNNEERARDTLARAFLVSIPAAACDPQPIRSQEVGSAAAESALRKASERLLELQREDGAWEGEMTWCPMLTAQYVLLQHILQRPLEPERRRRVLRHFEQTRLQGGLWGLHEHAQPSLFVTTLVYVASRVLAVERDDPSIESARRFLRAEGVLAIPSWGKFWLALLNLYDWRGLNVILPELWSLPRRLAFHPSNWYCHTRLIYLAMAAIYPLRFQAPVTPLTASLREELFPQGFDNVDFSAGRNRLRDADLYARPGILLRTGYLFARLFERCHSRRLRARCLQEMIGHIKWELRSSSHTSISPVSGLLNILALWLRDPDDADCRQALAKLEDWFWEDEERGARITGARSASWDTGFALQALAAAPESSVEIRNSLQQGADFLQSQQIQASFEGYRKAFRSDPNGGWCFAGVWHGWPVTDCTAEAVLGMLAAHPEATNTTMLGDAIQFILRGQNRDGGFGSYETRRSAISLEWLNPAELFGESMTENSYVECTASCLAALAACKQHAAPGADQAVMRAMDRADAWLRRTQTSAGAWRGVWGVQFIYGTYFGVRGLLAAGARPGDPALNLACRWLLERQHGDGGWGEHHSGCLTGRYVEHEESQVVQTAWALLALLEAGDSNWPAIARGARFLLDTQEADGSWPRQDMTGVFFRTALLDYALYRNYFPLHALGLYERRRRARMNLLAPPAMTLAPLAETG